MSFQTKDYELPLGAEKIEGISSLSFNPSKLNNFLVATSWDSKIRLWEIHSLSSASGKAAMSADAPILCSAWSSDGKILFGSCDNKLRLWDPQINQCKIIGQHDAPIRTVAWVDDFSLAMTGSWDKTLRFWDVKTNALVGVNQLPERVYCMDVRQNLCVVGTAERQIHIYDLKKPGIEFKKIPSPLKYQSRAVSCFPDKSGFAIGSIEGRVAIQYLNDNDSGNFAFKCHREGNDIYSVNSISFHNVHGTFATAGSDGSFHFWDKDSKQRLKQFQRQSNSISAATFNFEGNLYAYAVSYDWSKGYEFHNPHISGNIFLHAVTDGEIKKRPKTN